jgi:hypothetical protein
MGWATFWAIFSKTHLVTLIPAFVVTDYELLTKMIEDVENFLEVKALGEDLAWTVIKLWMQSAGRDLNNYQASRAGSGYLML